MEITVESVLAAAMQLPVNDRLDVASHLLEADAPDDQLFHLDDPELIAELDRRCADEELGIPWQELRDEKRSSSRG
jgi:hypothetical protein